MNKEQKIAQAETNANKTKDVCKEGFLKEKHTEYVNATNQFKLSLKKSTDLSSEISENSKNLKEIDETMNELLGNVSNSLKIEVKTDSLIYNDFFPITLTEMKRLPDREKKSKAETIISKLGEVSSVTVAKEFKNALNVANENYKKLIEKSEDFETEKVKISEEVTEKENNFDKIEKSFKKLIQSILTKKEFDAIFKVKQN